MRGLAFALALGVMPGVVTAGSSGAEADSPAVTRATYAGLSDEELTGLAADWDSLDRRQRRALLTEMRVRMARNGDRNGVIHIRTERRYGRIIRQADGRVIRIETQVVHVRPANPAELEAQRSFGLGFEQRVGDRGQPEAAPALPTAPEPVVAPQSVSTQSGSSAAADEPSLNDLLESLEPSTRAPGDGKLPIYQVSDPES